MLIQVRRQFKCIRLLDGAPSNFEIDVTDIHKVYTVNDTYCIHEYNAYATFP